MDSQDMSNEHIRAVATQAVEGKLNIKDFITRHATEILDELEECEKSAEETRENVEFLAEAFPVVSSVIHVGSNRSDYKNAVQWVSKRLDTAEADSALTALTLLYLVHKGLSERSTDSAKSRLWHAIRSKVDTLLGHDPWMDAGEERIANASSSEGESLGLAAESDNSG